jgi:hypothetical protein
MGMADPSNQMQMNKKKARHHSPYRDGNKTGTNPQRSTSLITWGEFSGGKRKRTPSTKPITQQKEKKKNAKQAPRKENTPRRMNQKDGCKSRCITEQLCRNRRKSRTCLSGNAHGAWTWTRSICNILGLSIGCTGIWLAAVAGATVTVISRWRRAKVEASLGVSTGGVRVTAGPWHMAD